MMRDFGKTELLRYKCPICGSLNKKFVPIMYKHAPYGYALHCCNCGYVSQFIDPPKSLGGLYNGHFMAGEEKEQKCIAINHCKHKSCPLHGSYRRNLLQDYEDLQKENMVPKKPHPKKGPAIKRMPRADELYLGVYGSMDNDNVVQHELELNVNQEDFR